MENSVNKEKVYKQSPEVREYFRKKAEERRIKQRKCNVCGDQHAIIKRLDTKQKLCIRCNMEYCIQEAKKEQQTEQIITEPIVTEQVEQS